jgi:hypothetical protein
MRRISLALLLAAAVLVPTYTGGAIIPAAIAEKLVLVRRSPVEVPVKAVAPRTATVPARTVTAQKMGFLVLCVVGEAGMRLHSR